MTVGLNRVTFIKDRDGNPHIELWVPIAKPEDRALLDALVAQSGKLKIRIASEYKVSVGIPTLAAPPPIGKWARIWNFIHEGLEPIIIDVLGRPTILKPERVLTIACPEAERGVVLMLEVAEMPGCPECEKEESDAA
jgi:hypothetical protein